MLNIWGRINSVNVKKALWVADELMMAMGGRIVARNNADGGATVSLYLQQAA